MPRVDIATPTERRLAERRLASLAEAADYLGTCDWTVRRYIAAGALTGYRTGPRLIRVDLNELDAMLAPIPTGGASAA
jgi:excisionase family DNA binding protein